MKKLWLVAAGLVVLALAAVGLTGCSSEGTSLSGGNLKLGLNSQQEGIWVNGEGKVKVTPDMAVLGLGIEAQEASVAEAQAKAAGAMDKVIAALKDEGVAEKDIQTRYFNIQKVTRWDDKAQQEVVIGYRVTNTVTAKVRDVTKAGVVIDVVVVAGGDLTRIDSISFTIDDPTPYYNEARSQAVADAAAKAKQLAGLVGVKLGKVTYITESSYTPGPIYRDAVMLKAEGASDATTPVSPGELEITANVQITYAID